MDTDKRKLEDAIEYHIDNPEASVEIDIGAEVFEEGIDLLGTSVNKGWLIRHSAVGVGLGLSLLIASPTVLYFIALFGILWGLYHAIGTFILVNMLVELVNQSRCEAAGKSLILKTLFTILEKRTQKDGTSSEETGLKEGSTDKEQA